MKQRVKFALADVKYVQAAIEKILNRVTNSPQKPQPQENRQKTFETPNKPSPSRHNTLTPTLKKHSTALTHSANASPTNNRNPQPITKVETFGSPSLLKSIFNLQPIIQTQEEPKKAVAVLERQEGTEQVSQKKIMMMWRERAGMTQTKQVPKIEVKKEEKKKEESKISPPKSPLKKAKQQPKSPKSPKKKRVIEPVDDFIGANTITLPQRRTSSPIRKNAIPLRTDEDFLIHRYSYGSPVTQKEEQLKQKYKILDLRLQRLKEQVTVRPYPTLTIEGGQIQLKNDKKFALQKYYRYSPLTKLIRINDKLKKDHERSITSQDRKRKERSVSTETGKRKWIK